MANTAGGLPVVSNPFIADIFADEAIAFDTINGTIRITLATIKMAEAAAPSPMQYRRDRAAGDDGARRAAAGDRAVRLSQEERTRPRRSRRRRRGDREE